MVIISHDNNQIKAVLNASLEPLNIIYNTNKGLVSSILEITNLSNPNDLLVWCHEDLLTSLNLNAFKTVFHHNYILATFNTTKTSFLTSKIDYLERSICLKYNTDKSYGTYLMSSQVGGMYVNTFLKFKDNLNTKSSLSYNLNSLAKNYQIEGLFCYNEPSLLKNSYKIIEEQSISNTEFFVFIREHYKWVWVWFMLLSLMFHEKKLYLFQFLNSWFYTKKQLNVNIDVSKVVSNKVIKEKRSIDVVIPTIGRKTYLHNVLKDLSHQTTLPKQVIIVEQNGDENSVSELSYLEEEIWPFKITHKFTHQLGVCNARNVALNYVENDWVFFADDDIRFETNLFEETFNTIEKYGAKALNYSCLQPNQKQTFFKIAQTYIFGSGSSFVNAKIAKKIKFSPAFEFGFGEDTDYGAKIRALGHDVVFAASINLTHLKAPMGGFRQPIPKLWDNESLKPKPAPTMLLLFKNHFTVKQLKGYKLFLFIKMNAKKNPLKLVSNYKTFKKSWNKSVFYANKLSTNFDA